ncbi:hypothetical protein [Kitasatospora sp. NPDC088779]|uniref:hypothetical protein n=1 Tax=Kitasatospora sp. NPDC088779 TaxID=3154964 RepID=UPI003443D1A4
MRLRLRAAVHAVLRSPTTTRLNDTDRLLRIVTIAKAELARTCATTSAAPELARWLGVSASAVHQSLARQRAASTLVTRQRFREAGTVQGLLVGVPEQIAALRAGDRLHPLALDRPALATLLRLIERLFGPGWHHRDGRETPPGLLASRTGRGAPTDRLALLLLVLEARPDGRVRLCSGRVCKRGRAAATLARLLGNNCTPAGAAGVLQRLQSADTIRLVRWATRSQLHQRSAIVVPNVVEDWATLKAARRRASVSQGTTGAAVTRPRRRSAATPPQVAGPGLPGSAEFAENCAGEALHASHAGHRGSPGQADVADGVSGEAETGAPTIAGGARAHARKPGMVQTRPGNAPTTAVPATFRPARTPEHRSKATLSQLSLSKTVYRVLQEAAALLPRMTAWEQREAARAAGAAVRDVAGDAGRVARRLRFRFASAASIASPYGWLVRIGLRRISDCRRVECESAVDVVTGLECAACGYLAEGLISRSRHGSTPAGSRSGPAVAGLAASEAEGLEVRQIGAVRAEPARLAAPCPDCGASDAAGLCPGCSRGRAIKAGISECINLALAAHADLRDYTSVRTVWERTRSELRSVRHEARNDTEDMQIAEASELLAVAFMRDRYRQDALLRFAHSPTVAAESRGAYAAMMRSRHRFGSVSAARRAAAAAATAAADRAARLLLDHRMATVTRIRSSVAARSSTAAAHRSSACPTWRTAVSAPSTPRSTGPDEDGMCNAAPVNED